MIFQPQLNATVFGSKFVILMFPRAYLFVRAIHDSSLLVRHRDQIGTNMTQRMGVRHGSMRVSDTYACYREKHTHFFMKSMTVDRVFTVYVAFCMGVCIFENIHNSICVISLSHQFAKCTTKPNANSTLPRRRRRLSIKRTRMHLSRTLSCRQFCESGHCGSNSNNKSSSRCRHCHSCAHRQR